MSEHNSTAPDAAPAPRSWREIAASFLCVLLGRRSGAPDAEAPGPLIEMYPELAEPPTQAPTPTQAPASGTQISPAPEEENTMATKAKKTAAKVSSSRVAAIAGRILAGKPYSEAEARALAASVVAQAEKGRSAAKKAKRAS